MLEAYWTTSLLGYEPTGLQAYWVTAYWDRSLLDYRARRLQDYIGF